MSYGLNKVMIIGHLGRDPEMRYTPSGRPVTTFTVATSRSWNTADGERHTETEWFNVVTWSKLAETCSQFLQKGRRAYVEGRLQTRSWEGADGQRRFRTEVIANSVLFLDRVQAAPLQEEAAPVSVSEAASEQVDPDDLPFE